jgi:hypothetical protein
MNATQKIKATILKKLIDNGDIDLDFTKINESNIDAIYDEQDEKDCGELQDARSEFRYGKFRTGLESEYSRHYESESVVSEMFDGSYVGWTYWFGGGKYGEPESMDWMGEAYELNCAEEQKMMTIRTFTKIIGV